MQSKIRAFINLKKLTFLPNWSILIIDFVISALVATSNFAVFKFLGVEFYNVLPSVTRLTILLGVLMCYFILFKTYSGIIRYSSLKDATRIFKAVFSAFLTIATFDTFYFLTYNSHVFVLMQIFFSTLLICFTLVSFRIFIKTLFKYFTGAEEQKKAKNIVIIGVNSTTIALGEALVNDSSTYKLRFFIDKNKYLNDKKILGIPVIAKSNSIIAILRYNKIKHVVLIKNYLPENEELELLNDCLRFKINVYNAKLVSDFDSDVSTVKSLKKYTINELMFRDTINIDNPNVIETFKERTVLVTGGAGSIGSEIVNQIAKFNPHRIVIVDQAETPLNSIQLKMAAAFPQITCEYELVDVTNSNEIQSVFEKYKPEIVFHAAAYKHVPVLENNFMQAIKVNVFGTKNVLDAALKFESKRFVFVSTDKAVNPTNIMGASKRLAEILVQSAYYKQKSAEKLQIIITRFGNVLGSNGSVVNLFEEQIKNGGPITVTHPDINRFFMTIPEACKLVLEAGTMGAGGEIFVFDMGKPIFIRELAEKMIRLSGKEPYKDIDIVYSGLRPGEKLYEELLADSSKTLPTYHSKILIAQDPVHCFESVSEFLFKLKDNSFETKEDLIDVIRELVPEFIQTPQE
ncbi:nucleoside-diphosphate sugar epimerase/dehydratase [Flavobacterium sp.]|uniref:polysaccharide biosynthesis protein n=1 Tax=Flavobacterium sp. TaxID=239 RepID=UPI001B7B72AA|nr:nucleoside-diphosphate sugar epimerase/dehydratase [Flavobacterium sp.]MBP6128212.1 polysaccharide biosynthesis protein [Flavobacterium sp.]